MKKKVFRFLIIILLAFLIYMWYSLKVWPPIISDTSALDIEIEQIDENTWECGDSWLKLNDVGLWEMYVTGTPFELGVKAGKLTQDLNHFQEEAFVTQLKIMIPSEKYLNKLKYLIAFFNRNMERYVPLENQQEIYGYAQYASSEFEYIASNYQRMLNYHAAHDIGHAMQNLNLVACTAFAEWGSRTRDSSIIIARNFDFYMGDDFAKNKIVAFYKPENGYPFMMITWAGMTGVVSGMNLQGLTITLNAAKSEIPLSAKTPVSILARNILQHAKTIDEAYEIAKNTKTFVSESFLVGSAIDNRVVVIEKSPSKIDIYESGKNELILTNHFQSETFKNTKLTLENVAESPSYYRYQRVKQLLGAEKVHTVKSMAAILRNPWGMNDTDIGMGNEKAVNQFIAHHGIIFKPQQKRVWVASSPYQMGKFVMYDLGDIFNENHDLNKDIYNSEGTIKADPFLKTDEYKDMLLSRKLTQKYKNDTMPVSSQELTNFIELNKKYFQSYNIAGDKYLQMHDTANAIRCYKASLKCEIPSFNEEKHIDEKLNALNGFLVKKYATFLSK